MPDEIVESSTAPEAEAIEVEARATESTETEAPEDQAPKDNSVQKRINQLTREKHEARQAAEELRQKLEALEAQKAPAAPDLQEPKFEQFDSDEEYQRASAEYVANLATQRAIEAVRGENSSRDEAQRAATEQLEMAEKKAKFESDVDAKRGNFENFDEVAYGHQFMDVDMAAQIFEAEKGPEVAYYLGSHLDEAERIFRLSPIQRARELTKLEFQVDSVKPKRVSGAPDPITPLGGKESVEIDPDRMSPEQWRDWRNKQIHG